MPNRAHPKMKSWLCLFIKDYDERNYPLPPVNVPEVIKDKMQERGMKAKDLENVIGSKGHIIRAFGTQRTDLENGETAEGIL